MDKKLKNYIIYLSILTIGLMVVYFFIIKDQLPLEAKSQCAYVIPGYFIITLVTHFFLSKAFAKKPENFSISFMGGLAFKMMASLAFLTAMYIAFDGITKPFVGVFMGVYLVYTLFEIIYLKPMSAGKK